MTFNENATKNAVENGFVEVVFGEVKDRTVVTVRVVDTNEVFTGMVEA